jgi:adenylosuccinate lyase
VKEHGAANDLLSRLATDPAFAKVDLTGALDPRRYIGRAPEQVDTFIANVIAPIRNKHRDDLMHGPEDVRI